MNELYDFAFRTLDLYLRQREVPLETESAEIWADIRAFISQHRMIAGMIEAEMRTDLSPDASWVSYKPTGRKAVLLILEDRQKASQP